MSIKAQIRTDACGNTTIYLEGGLDYENSLVFKRELQRIVKKNPSNTVILDLYKLDFVGSSGVLLFAKTLKEFLPLHPRLKVHNVKSEFLRVFKMHGLDLMEKSRFENFPSPKPQNR